MKLLNKNSISSKIVYQAVGLVLGVLLIIGTAFGVIMQTYNQKQYNLRMKESVALMDSGINNLFDNLSSVIMMFTEKDLVKQSNGYITSYKNLTDPSGKVKMDPNKMGSYERQIYYEMGSIVNQFSGVQELCVGLDSEGNYVQYPASNRSNNYDCSVRSWYKSAKAKAGAIDITDAYQSSNGLASILVSRYFTDEHGKGRGVVSMTAGLDFFKELTDSLRDVSKNEGYFVISDQTGAIILDQHNLENNFKETASFFPTWEHGVSKEFIQKIDGVKYDVRIYPSSNKYVPLDFIMVTPYSVVNSIVKDIVLYVTIPAVLIFVLSIVLSMLLSRSICKPLDKTVKLLKDIS